MKPSTILGDDGIVAANETLPDYMVGGLLRYMNYGTEPGDFLRAVITNDLGGAFGRADENNTAAMRNWVAWFYTYAPGPSWGSPTNYAEWVATRGLYGAGPLDSRTVLHAQKRYCGARGLPMFFPWSGACYACGCDVTQTPQAQFNCDTEHLTGCPLCHASWCD